jgi:hypothetical protein
MSPDIEKPFRKSLGHALRNEIDQLHEGLALLTEEQIGFCVKLCAYVSGHVAIDACGKQWPDPDNLRQLGKAATESANAEAFGLKEEDAYAYVKRVALRGEPLNTVLSPPKAAITLSFYITAQLIAEFSGDYDHWWDYLDVIETAWETAQATDPNLLPSLMLRSYRDGFAAERERQSGTGAVSS